MPVSGGARICASAPVIAAGMVAAAIPLVSEPAVHAAALVLQRLCCLSVAYAPVFGRHYMFPDGPWDDMEQLVVKTPLPRNRTLLAVPGALCRL